jgi:hypothetical protein
MSKAKRSDRIKTLREHENPHAGVPVGERVRRAGGIPVRHWLTTDQGNGYSTRVPDWEAETRRYRAALESVQRALSRIGHPVVGLTAQRGHDKAKEILRQALEA